MGTEVLKGGREEEEEEEEKMEEKDMIGLQSLPNGM